MGILAAFSDLVSFASLKLTFRFQLSVKSHKAVSYFIFSATISSLLLLLCGTQSFVVCGINFQPCARTTFANSVCLLEPLGHVRVTSASICLF